MSLIGKDLRATALYLSIKVPTLGLLLLGALVAGKAFLVVASVMAAILIVVAPALDWSVGADAFVHSLPVSRADVVRARYALSLLLAAGCFILATVMAVTFAWVRQAHGLAWPAWVAAETALTGVIYISAFVAIFLASVYRLGIIFGGIVTTMIFAVLSPAGIRLVAPSAVADLSASIGSVAAGAGIVVVMAALLWLSMRISIRSYERREF